MYLNNKCQIDEGVIITFYRSLLKDSEFTYVLDITFDHQNKSLDNVISILRNIACYHQVCGE